MAFAGLAGAWMLFSDRWVGALADNPFDHGWWLSLGSLLLVGAAATALFARTGRRRQGRYGVNDAPAAGLRFWLSPTAAFSLFWLAVVGSGLSFYYAERLAVTRHTNDELSAVARLKVGQIETWLNDTRHDMQLTVGSAQFLDDLQKWLDGGRRDDARRERLLTQLRWLSQSSGMRDVSLRSVTDGTALLASEGHPDAAEVRMQAVEAAGRSHLSLEDFHFEPEGDGKYLDLGLFLPLHREGTAPALAVAHASLEPGHLLFPLIQQWPGSSRTAETVLARRDGDQVTFLNELRHRADTALQFRLPLDTSHLVAAKAFLRGPGFYRGDDYRGMPVLAYALPIGGTPWIVVSKIDEAEAYAQLRMLAVVSTATGIILLAVMVWWWGERERHAAARHSSELERERLAKRLDYLARYSNDGILLLDAAGRLLDVNDRALSAFGYTREEMLRLSESDLRAAGPSDAAPALPERLAFRDSLIYEVDLARKNGSVFPAEASVRVIEVEGSRCYQSTLRDLTDRKKAEARILTLSRLYATLSAVNRAVVHSRSPQEVFREVCAACIEHGGFRMAWVGLADLEAQRIVPVEAAGVGTAYLDQVVVCTGAETPEGRGPTALAFRARREYVCADFAADPATAPWRERAARYGFRSSVALPLCRAGQAVGALMVYAGEPRFFDEAAVRLLREMAESLSFAIERFDREARRLQAEEALRASEARLQEAQATARTGDWELDLKAKEVSWSPQLYRLFERDPAQGVPPADELMAYYLGEFGARTWDGVRCAIDGSECVELEQHLRLPSGTEAWHHTVIKPAKDAAGRVVRVNGTVQDITERKLAEAKLQKYAKEIEDLYEHAPCGYHSVDVNGFFVRINRTELEWLGYGRDEVVGKMTFGDLVVPGQLPAWRENLSRFVQRGEVHDLEYEMVRKDGSTFPVIVSASAIRDAQGRIIMSRSTVVDISERKKLEEERADHMRRQAELSRRLVAVQEDERRRLSAELHDRTSPNLAAIKLNLGMIASELPRDVLDSVESRLDDTRALLQDANASVREICADLRPPILDYAGLLPALRGYVREFSRRTGIAVRVADGGGAIRLAHEVESLLFRIVQEALTNCAKHARADVIDVELKHDLLRVVMTIQDNGVGFDVQALEGGAPGLGLLTMRERAEFAGGRFSIESHPGQGTQIRVEV